MIVILVLIVPVALALFVLWMERLEAVILHQPPVPVNANAHPEPDAQDTRAAETEA